MGKVLQWIKFDVVLTAAWILAILSACIVHPDREYLTYIDWRTLVILFSLMLVVAGFRSIGLFEKTGEILLVRIHTTRGLEILLVMLCFFSSMLITNDVALMTFVPFAIGVLSMAGLKKRIIFVVAMQTAAANLGSMMLPTGNPQNLYLYGCSGMTLSDFIRVILPYSFLSLFLLLIVLLVRKNEKSDEIALDDTTVDVQPMVIYGILFIIAVCVVARMLPVVALAIVFAVVLVYQKQLYKQVDYSLLAIFAGFFIFVGNMQRMDAVREMLSTLMQSYVAVTAVVASQVISNVPTALLLSAFTDQWKMLIIGTNLGGLGTLIASMASLISYRLIARMHPEMKKRYLIIFTVINLLLLACNLGLFAIIGKG